MPNEFSKILPLFNLREPVETELLASPMECAALARRFEIIGLNSLVGRLTVSRSDNDGEYVVAGTLQAEVVQECVVTFEPVTTRIDETVLRVFGPPQPQAVEIELDPLNEEPEPLADDELDLGELIAEELALAIDPYPRDAAATEVLRNLDTDEIVDNTEDDGAKAHPFASLKARIAQVGKA